MRNQAPHQRQVRVKKLSRTAGQSVLREDQLDSTEYHSLQANYNVETGVEKSEEKARDQCSPSYHVNHS
jgi:enhancer of polycomb-like protein